MATVELTRHLYQFFPLLEGRELVVEAKTIAEVVSEMERLAPGFAFYVCDEPGRLRRHVNVFVDALSIGDRNKLSDPVKPDSRVFIMYVSENRGDSWRVVANNLPPIYSVRFA